MTYQFMTFSRNQDDHLLPGARRGTKAIEQESTFLHRLQQMSYSYYWNPSKIFDFINVIMSVSDAECCLVLSY